MNKFLKVLFCIVFFACLAAPALYLFGAHDNFVHLYGWEKKVTPPPLTVESFKTRQYQDAFTESYAKQFFLRRTFLKTAYQIREWMNFGLFHYGYNQSIMEGKDEFLFERPYSQFHLRCPRPAGRAKYEKVLSLLKEIDAYCTSIGAEFVFATVPDKQQLYPEYLPWWHQRLWDYANYDVQGEMESICTEAGIKVYNGCRYMLSTKPSWEHSVFPPAGAHYNAYGSGLLYEGFLDAFDKIGKNKLKRNRFVGVRRIEEMWSVDDDIGNLLNIWYNPRMERNVHFAPIFEQTNVTMNAGSVILMGDCYREQVAKIFQDAHLFDPKKIVISQRHTGQKPEKFVPVVGDLKLFIMVFQSFNSGRLDERYEEIDHIFKALKTAREKCRLPAPAATKAEVSFKPGAWSTNDWILVKSPRFNYMHGFVQREDGIENECPPVSGEEIFKKHCRDVYSAMVLREKAEIGQTVSSAMSFDWRMAPLIVLAEKLDKSESGEPTFGEHWEIVLYDEGLNVWHHSIKDGKPFWYLAAYLKVPFARNTRYDLEVKVSKTRKGVKEMVVTCGGHEFGYVDNDLPDAFYAGIIGCEGRNRFYDFKVQ